MAKYQIDYTTVKVCPVCGSTDLVAEMVVNVHQEEQGNWAIINPDDGSLDYAMSDPNVRVKCNNPYCGKLRDVHGLDLPFTNKDDALAFFTQSKGIVLPEMTEEHLRTMYPELHQEYVEWTNGFQHIPWEGTIGECNTL